MSNLSQFYSGSDDNIELELWVVSGGGGGGAKGFVGTPGGGGGGGIYYNHITVPRGSTISCVIGAGGAGGDWVPATNTVFGGLAGGRSYVQINKGDSFAKTYTVAGGGYGGWGGGYSSEGGDGGCGGGAGHGGNFNSLDPGITYSAYKSNSAFGPSSVSVPFRATGRSYYTLKDSYWSIQTNQTNTPQPNRLNNGYYGSDASTTVPGQAGGVLMPIPGLLNVSTPGYYSSAALWGWAYNPHNDIPIVSMPGGTSNSVYSTFLGYANTGNGGNGGASQTSGSSGSSGFIFFRYSNNFNPPTYTDTANIKDVTFSNIYNFFSGFRAYMIVGATSLTLPTS